VTKDVVEHTFVMDGIHFIASPASSPLSSLTGQIIKVDSHLRTSMAATSRPDAPLLFVPIQVIIEWMGWLVTRLSPFIDGQPHLLLYHIISLIYCDHRRWLASPIDVTSGTTSTSLPLSMVQLLERMRHSLHTSNWLPRVVTFDDVSGKSHFILDTSSSGTSMPLEIASETLHLLPVAPTPLTLDTPTASSPPVRRLRPEFVTTFPHQLSSLPLSSMSDSERDHIMNATRYLVGPYIDMLLDNHLIPTYCPIPNYSMVMQYNNSSSPTSSLDRVNGCMYSLVKLFNDAEMPPRSLSTALNALSSYRPVGAPVPLPPRHDHLNT
jgi:hypothetical protein